MIEYMCKKVLYDQCIQTKYSIHFYSKKTTTIDTFSYMYDQITPFHD
jgi:hypothetical protein